MKEEKCIVVRVAFTPGSEYQATWFHSVIHGIFEALKLFTDQRHQNNKLDYEIEESDGEL